MEIERFGMSRIEHPGHHFTPGHLVEPHHVPRLPQHVPPHIMAVRVEHRIVQVPILHCTHVRLHLHVIRQLLRLAEVGV